MRVRILLFALLALTAFSCKEKGQPARPEETYEERFVDKTSTVSIPLEFSIAELENIINFQLQGTLYEDNSFDDGDNMKVLARKRENIRLQAGHQSVTYRVPVGLWIKYNLGLGTVEGTGDIAMEFTTRFSIDSTWRLRTKTELKGYDWLKAPRLRLAGVSVPVETISNYFIRRSTSTIGKSIDDLISENVKLEEHMREAWKLMFDPMEVSPEYQAWLTVSPQRITMTPLVTSDGRIRSTIIVESKPRLSFGSKPITPPPPRLPAFSYGREYIDDFTVYVGATVSYTEAERLLRQSIQGERFEQGKKSVTVEGIDLYGQGNQLIVNVQLSGSYDGNIYLTGYPAFNPQTNSIDINNLEYTLDTRNFLYRSAGWLLKGTFKNMIQDNLDFLLKYNLEDMQKQMQEQLNGYEVARGIKLNGQLNELDLYNAYLTSEGIEVSVALSGKLGLDVKGLTKLRW